jgi:hypothetical protein
MKRRDLEAHLRNHGCQLLRQGDNHAIWNLADVGHRRWIRAEE